jgi:hypothetical protein
MRFIDLVYDVFQRNCKDLNEIRHLVALLFPLYVKPVKEGKSMSVIPSKGSKKRNDMDAHH